MNTKKRVRMMDNNLLALLRCPIDGNPLELSDDGAYLINQAAQRRYPIENGIAMLLPEHAQNSASLPAPDEPQDD